ncbi:MAG TPA: M23 family metallopeptidase [Gemmatimonadaceae bacterium]
MSRAALAGALVLAWAAPADAQRAALVISPGKPEPGAVVRLTLSDAPGGGDPAVAVRGAMAGEQLHFVYAGGGAWRALGAVPVDASDSVVARVVVERASGTLDSARAVATLPRPRTAPAPRRLAVATRFTQPLDSATQARIADENRRATAIGRSAHSTPPLWSEPFLQPRESRVTSRFGSGRSFNGTVTSRHLGVDFSGGTGAPVRAANRGVVALVDTFFLAGQVIYVDHGAGIVTGYFHLSETLVSPGDTVDRGQRIGSVGASGRVTGPHLHWSARYGALAVNPLDLIAAGGWYGSAAGSGRAEQAADESGQ